MIRTSGMKREETDGIFTTEKRELGDIKNHLP